MDKKGLLTDKFMMKSGEEKYLPWTFKLQVLARLPIIPLIDLIQ